MSDNDLGKGFRESSNMARMMDAADKENNKIKRVATLIIAIIAILICVAGMFYMAGAF